MSGMRGPWFRPGGVRTALYAGGKAYGAYKRYMKGSSRRKYKVPRGVAWKPSMGSMVNWNNKFWDQITLTTMGSDDTWFALDDPTIKIINGCGQGVSENDRIGSIYYVTGIYSRLQFKYHNTEVAPTVHSEPIRVRVVIIHNTATSSVIADMTEVFKGADTDSSSITKLLQMRDLNFTTKYRVVFDKIYYLYLTSIVNKDSNGIDSPEPWVQIKINMPFKKPIKVKTIDTGQGVAITQDHSWSTFACWDYNQGGSGPTAHVDATNYSRCKFKG